MLRRGSILSSTIALPVVFCCVGSFADSAKGSMHVYGAHAREASLCVVVKIISVVKIIRTCVYTVYERTRTHGQNCRWTDHVHGVRSGSPPKKQYVDHNYYWNRPSVFHGSKAVTSTRTLLFSNTMTIVVESVLPFPDVRSLCMHVGGAGRYMRLICIEPVWVYTSLQLDFIVAVMLYSVHHLLCHDYLDLV